MRLSIGPARFQDLASMAVLAREFLPRSGVGEKSLKSSLKDSCLLAGRLRDEIVAISAMDLDNCEVSFLLVTPKWRRLGIATRMMTATERLAIQFGFSQLLVRAGDDARAFLLSCRYQKNSHGHFQRNFPRRQTRYGRRIADLLRDIGISGDYGRDHRLMLQEEARELASIGPDVHGREQLLAPPAARAWHALRDAALGDGVKLDIASAFRTVEYQASIIERKQKAGQDLARILKVSAAPGFSEHHTGRAIDITTPGAAPLENEFEDTLAFEWLTANGRHHDFRLSYPRRNRHRIAYEPWHWFFTG